MCLDCMALVTYVPFLFSSSLGTAICKCLCSTSRCMKAQKSCPNSKLSKKIAQDKKITIYFQNFSRDDSRQTTPRTSMHVTGDGTYGKSPHQDILSRGPRVPSYATVDHTMLLHRLQHTFRLTGYVISLLSDKSYILC